MNNELKKAKSDIRRIELFCRSKPMKTPTELIEFIFNNGMEELKEIAYLIHELEGKKAYYLYTKKVNKSRL